MVKRMLRTLSINKMQRMTLSIRRVREDAERAKSAWMASPDISGTSKRGIGRTRPPASLRDPNLRHKLLDLVNL